MLGNNVLEDIERGFFADMNEETESVCNALQQDQHLRNGYNLIGQLCVFMLKLLQTMRTK